MEVRVQEIHFAPIKIMYSWRGKFNNTNFIFVRPRLLREYKTVATHERQVPVLFSIVFQW